MDEVPASPEVVKKRKSRRKTLSFKQRSSLSLNRGRPSEVKPDSNVEDCVTVLLPDDSKIGAVRDESNVQFEIPKENNLLYFDVDTENIELAFEDPLESAAILERANQIELENVAKPSEGFLANVRNRFVRIEEVIESEDEPAVEESVVVVKREANVSRSRKANYSYTQFDLDTQVLGICEAADILAGLNTNPEHELKDWSSPLKKQECESATELIVEGQSHETPLRRKDRWNNVRQSSFSRNSISIQECRTPPSTSRRDVTSSITLDFSEDSESELVVDFSKIKSSQLRKRLEKIQNYIDSPPQPVRKTGARKTFSKKKSPADSPQTPVVVRRLSYESNVSERTNGIEIEPNHISSEDETDCAVGSQPEEQPLVNSSPEGDNFDSSLLIKANINQLSQFFLQSVESKTPCINTESPEVPPQSSTPISLPSDPVDSPQLLNIAWLFRSDSESEFESGEEPEAETCPDKHLHRLLDDDDDFLVQLHPSQKKEATLVPVSVWDGDKPGEFSECQFTKPLPPDSGFKSRTTPSSSVGTEFRLPSTDLPIPSFEGFQTAGGSGVKISEKALAKARAIWTDEEQKLNEDKVWQSTIGDESCAVSERIVAPSFAEFSTAAGSSVQISANALAKAERLWMECEDEGNFGFKTARGSDVKISETALAKARAMVRDVEQESEMQSFGGFKTAAGSSVQASESALTKAQYIFEQIETDLQTENEPSDCMGFQTARGGTIKVSDNALSKAQSLFQQMELEAEDGFGDNAEHINNGFRTACGKTMKVSEMAIAKAQAIFQEVESEPVDFEKANGVTKRSRDVTDCDAETPLKKYKAETVSNNLVSRFSTSTPNCNGMISSKHHNDKTELEHYFGELDDHDFQQLFSNTEPVPSNSRRVRPMKQVRLMSRFEQYDSTSPVEQNFPVGAHWDDSFGDVVAKLNSDEGFKVAQQIVDARRLARQRQKDYIDNKPEADRRPRLSEFVRQKRLIGRKTLQQVLGDGKPFAGVDDIPERLRELSVANAVDFKFDMIQLYGKAECLENIEGILLGDRDATTRLLFNDRCQVGFPELSSAFLASPGIDPALIPHRWIENYWVWILIKLSSMERNLPDHFGGVTTPENVFNQLFYRYHVEIDCAKRSVIRKMLEKDDIAGKRMVLFVSRVFRGPDPFDAEVELCDGWYPIRTVLDSPLIQAVLRGRIAIGTKLMIQGAELLNLNEGCSPLEVPADVRLKIHANSTRRTRWNTRLGLYRVPSSFVISCNDVLDRGGLVVSLEVVIVRIYPMMYVDKTQRDALGSVLRSERVERRRTLESDSNRFENLQALFSQVQKEVEAEKGPQNARNLNSRLTRSTTTTELLALVEAGLDLSCIEVELSATQREVIMDHQRRKQEECLQEVNRRVKERMNCQVSKRKVSSLLKVRVVDARKPEKVLLLSIWRPPEDLCEMLLEQKAFEIRNATANGTRNGEVQLTTGKNSSFQPLSRQFCELPGQLLRQLTRIADIEFSSFRPYFNEFDTVGVVVQIGTLESKKFQTVYVSDAEMNLLCVNFWSGIKEYAYEDVIKERTVLCISNLQWRTINAFSVIPNSFATEYTTFSEHSKSEQSSEELQRLHVILNGINQDDFYEQCKIKIVELKDKKLPRTNSFNTPIRNYSATTPMRSVLGSVNSNAATTPTDFSPGVGQPVSLQKRKLEQLAAYKSPPKLSPIIMRHNPRVKKHFKTPARLEDRIDQVGKDDSLC
ncbi:breast cancer type 2 susceptibility protein homolog [Ochlerotatus camptorhynchus]|uniref:breast cancer type 2 susceptibility protein homolog n=1 Tax=Ochlerotatus camptorhynchus TaxID=644619 RepID=UPI0031DB8719